MNIIIANNFVKTCEVVNGCFQIGTLKKVWEQIKLRIPAINQQMANNADCLSPFVY